MKIFFTLLSALFVNILVAQSGKLTLHGRVENGTSGVPYTSFEVYKDNESFDKGTTMKNGAFKLDLELGSVYNIAFSKEGFVRKSVDIIAKSDSTIEGRYFFQIDIELFKVSQDEVDETLLPPIAKLYIREANEGFRFDKKYVNWTAGEYKELEE